MTTDFIEFQTNECVSDDKETINKSMQNRVERGNNNSTLFCIDLLTVSLWPETHSLVWNSIKHNVASYAVWFTAVHFLQRALVSKQGYISISRLPFCFCFRAVSLCLCSAFVFVYSMWLSFQHKNPSSCIVVDRRLSCVDSTWCRLLSTFQRRLLAILQRVRWDKSWHSSVKCLKIFC